MRAIAGMARRPWTRRSPGCEVGPGVLASFLTTICVFGPLTVLKGDIGNVMKFIPLVLIMTISVSLLEAFLVLPNHLSHSMGGEKKLTGLRRIVEDVRDLGAREGRRKGSRPCN